MAVPSSGQLRLYADIGTELGVAQSNVSLGTMSNTAGFTDPDAMSEFYGYASFTPYSVNFLVVAGGGGGGNSGGTGDGAGGGGAGGLRTSYGSTSGGNSSAENVFNVQNQTYIITVGAGGSLSTNGGDSTFATITSLGGGSGANASGNGAAGGSGGGGSCSGGARLGGAGTTGQGFAGASQPGSNSYACGGGGGAGQIGQQGHPNYNPRINRGGNGLANSITGSTIYYAGGGGGGSGWFAGSEYVAPALGGGGVGAWGDPLSDPTPDNDRATAGGTNTGGGGGGSTAREYRRFGGKPGGSGVVVLRMPTSSYSGIHTGNPSVQTIGSETILTFTQSGTYTA